MRFPGFPLTEIIFKINISTYMLHEHTCYILTRILTWDRNKNRKSTFTIVFVFIDFVQVDFTIMHHWHAELENNPL